MWNDSLKIGVDKIDEQHEMLFSKVDQLINDVLATGEYHRDKIISAVLFLKDYAVTHFADEEEYQLSINDVNYSKHKKLHENFIATVLKHEKKMVASNFAHDDVSDFTSTLLAWLIYHVSDADQKIGKTAEEAEATDNHADMICECFCNVISNISDIDKDSIIKVNKHNETFDNSVTVKYLFNHIINGYVLFDFSVSFINGLMHTLTQIPPDENGIGVFEKTFLLQISTTIIENVYQCLNAGEYKLREADVFITKKDETQPNEIFSFDTGIGIIEVSFVNM